MEQANRRGELVGLVGLILQLVFAAALLLIGYFWNVSLSTRVAGWYTLGGMGIWLAVWLVFRQQKLVDVEALETEQLRRHRESLGQDASGIFGLPGEGGPESLPAARRLRAIRRWVLPIFTLLIAAYQVVVGVLWIKWQLVWAVHSEDWPALIDPDLTLWFVAGVAFLCFLFSRYTSGMARQREWQMLRAGASYMFGTALACLAVVVGLAAARLFEAPIPERYPAWVIPIAMVAIGIECTFNFVLDVYRPRVPDVADRPGFDSRLLGLFSEPGGIAHTVAEAINYQFGFEVSKTWFYQLLQRAITPLIAFGFVTMLLLTCVVVIDAHELAILERFGMPQGGREGVLGPGIHLKLPSPIERAYKYPVERVQEFVLGFSEQEYTDISPEQLERELKVILWTSERHGPAPEIHFVAASRQVVGEGDSQAVVPSLINTNVLVQYRISDVFNYRYNHADPRTVLESLAWRQWVLYVAGTNLDDLLGSDRTAAARYLRQRIQDEADRAGLGVDITVVEVTNLHPPQQQKVAESFQEVIGALAEKEAAIRRAEAQENKVLAEVAGQKKRALDLAAAVEELERASTERNETALIEAARQKVERIFNGFYERQPDGSSRFIDGVGGQAASLVSDAQAYRWQKENEVRGRTERFRQELIAYRVSPRFYKLQKYLQVLSEGLAETRKYLIAADTKQLPLVIEFDVQTPPRPDIETFEPSQP